MVFSGKLAKSGGKTKTCEHKYFHDAHFNIMGQSKMVLLSPGPSWKN